MKNRRLRTIAKWLLGAFLMVIVTALASDWHVSLATKDYCADQLEELPNVHVGLVLGTSPKLSDGRENLYFTYRIDAAVALFEAGKIERILVSGDNRTVYYNEPEEMRRALISRGIPEDRIHLDYAGLRTLDSMVRGKEIFGQDSVIVVSQAFHNHRAVYIARANEMEAYGYNARDVSVAFGLKTRVREALARTKMLLDLYIFRTEPRHLGEAEYIPED